MNNDETTPRSVEEKSLPDHSEARSSDGNNPSASPPANASSEWWTWLSDASPRIVYGVFLVVSFAIGRWCGVPVPKTAFGFMWSVGVGALVLASPVLAWTSLFWVFDRLYTRDTTIPSSPVPGQWWLLFNGRPAGPFTSAWLVDAFAGGDFPTDSLIAPSGSTEWRTASQWPDWASADASGAPPTIIPPST